MSSAVFQKLAGTLMIVIVIVPVAAVLQALGFILGLELLAAGGRAVLFHGLPLLFAMAIAVGFAGGKGMAALSAAVSALVTAGVARHVAADPELNIGVLGGMAAGALATALYARCHRVQLPEYLGLFSGERLVPGLSALAAVPLGYLWGLAWPSLVAGIRALGHWVLAAGPAGAFVYGALDRLLLPTGLHHILNNLVEYQLGAFRDPATGATVTGEVQRFYAGDPSAGLLMSGFFIFNNFAVPAIALALAHSARRERRRKTGGLMATGLLTSVLTGITEPVEFAFIFQAPALWAVHVVLTGVAHYLTFALGVRLWGYAAPMFFINLHLATNPWWIVALGVPYFLVYYLLFRAAIRLFRLPVLGQEDDDGPADAAPAPEAGAAAGLAALAGQLLGALGGAGNLRTLNACATRLRLEVQDPGRVRADELRRLAGVQRVVLLGGGGVQVVVGPRAAALQAAMAEQARGAGSAPAGPGPGAAAGPGAGAPAQPPGAPAAVPGAGARTVDLVAPLSGTVVALEQVPDPAFADRSMWDGVAILPEGRVLVAPCAATVTTVFPSGHAVGLTGPGDLELLMHVGIDTVRLGGTGFTPVTAEGARVAPGEALIRFDPVLIAAAGYSLVTPILITDLGRVARVEVLAAGRVAGGATPLLRVTLRD